MTKAAFWTVLVSFGVLVLGCTARKEIADTAREAEAVTSLLGSAARDSAASADSPRSEAAALSPCGEPRDPWQAMAEMRVGFNLGNVFDKKVTPLSTREIEELIELFRYAGFRHVRVPVTWMDEFDGDHLADDDGNLRVGHERFSRLVSVVDFALSRCLYVILNAHHEKWLKDEYRGEASFDDKFRNLWTKIAKHFGSRSRRLLFEVLNEPEGAFGDFVGSVSPFDGESKKLTRRINAVGYEAIRASGAANAQRIVLVMPNAHGNHALLDDVYPTRLALPGGGDDPNVAVTVHTYDPWSFCGEDGSNASWPGAELLTAAIGETANHARALGVAVNYGEFGVGRRTLQAERDTDVVRDYYRITARTVRAFGMSATVWEDRGWFALVEKDATGIHRFKYGLAPAVMGEALRE